jgi:hypothetical protein
MLIVSSKFTKPVCLHPNAVLERTLVYCPDCKCSFPKRSQVYKEVASREPRQTNSAKRYTPSRQKRTPASVDPELAENRSKAAERNGKGTAIGSKGVAGNDCQRATQKRKRGLSRVKTPRTEVEKPGWNASAAGKRFWERVDLVWPFLTGAEQQQVYFDRAKDYPRSLEYLEAIETRRQIELPLEPQQPKQGAVVPRDANGDELKIGDRVTAAWAAGRDVYFGVIESFKGRTRIKAQGKWTEGRRAGDSDSFTVDASGLIKVVEANPSPEDFEVSVLQESIAGLEAERDRLIKEAEFAPDNGWIETGMVRGKAFKQAWWRGNFVGGKKTIYIGKEGSPEHKQAVNSQKARRQLKQVQKQIKQLRKEMDRAVLNVSRLKPD